MRADSYAPNAAANWRLGRWDFPSAMINNRLPSAAPRYQFPTIMPARTDTSHRADMDGGREGGWVGKKCKGRVCGWDEEVGYERL